MNEIGIKNGDIQIKLARIKLFSFLLNSYLHSQEKLPGFAVFREIFVFLLPIGQIDHPVPGTFLTADLILFRPSYSDN